MQMKHPLEREKPGRKNIYVDPVRVSVFIPRDLLDLLEQSKLDGSSRNQKLVSALRSALRTEGY